MRNLSHSFQFLKILALLFLPSLGLVAQFANAQGQTVLTIWSPDYFSPDIADPSLVTGSVFAVEVRVEDLPSSGMNGFDITVKYNASVIRATAVSRSGGLFDTSQAVELTRAVDSPSGSTRLAVVLLSETAYGSGALFTVTFQVFDTGASLIDIQDNVSLIVLGSDVIPYVGRDGSFSNQALPPRDFRISVTPNFQSIAPGTNATISVLMVSISGFNGTLALTVEVSPVIVDGPIVVVSPGEVFLPADGAATATVSVSTMASTPIQYYNATVTASDGTLTHSSSATLGVFPPRFGLRVSPNYVPVPAGSSAYFQITVDSQSGFAGEIRLGAEVIPSVSNGPMAAVYPPVVTLTPGSVAFANLTVSTTLNTSTGSYNVTVTASAGSITISATVSVLVASASDFAISANPLFVGLRAGESGTSSLTLRSLSIFADLITSSASVQPSAPISVSVSPNLVSLAPGGVAFSTLFMMTSPSTPAGGYNVTVTANSTSTIHTVIVNLLISPGNRPPVANFTSSPTEPVVGESVAFDGSDSLDPDGFITSWFWYFGDGFIGSGSFVFHTYFSPGVFNVSLTVSDNQGAQSTLNMPLTVRPRPLHDVRLVDIFVNNREAVSGQFVSIVVIVENEGQIEETFDLTLYYDSNVIDVVSVFLQSHEYRYLNLLWDTSGVSPGTYVISATAFLATDENPSNNARVDGPVTILPPPVVSISPGQGELGARVTVEGSGFPRPQFGPSLSIVLVSFDDQFLGFAIAEEGVFNFTFSVPHAEPGTHPVKVLDVMSGLRVRVDFQVLPSQISSVSGLMVSVDVGKIYFPGDSAQVYVLITQDGSPTSEGTLQITLVRPDGSTLTLDPTNIGLGLYRASYTVPRSSALGTYAVVAMGSLGDSEGSTMATFRVTQSWISSNAPRISSATAAVVGVAAVAVVAWKKGYFRRNDEEQALLLTA